MEVIFNINKSIDNKGKLIMRLLSSFILLFIIIDFIFMFIIFLYFLYNIILCYI